MMDDANTVQYHLGRLTAEVEGLKTSVENLAEAVGDNAVVAARVEEAIDRLPCNERLDSCQRERDSLSKRINHQIATRRERSGRWWVALGAVATAVIVGLFEALARFLWR